MGNLEGILLSITIYKTLSLIVGFGFGYLGYRLFISGVYEKAGELKAAWGDNRLILKQAAPGTFFSLFGAIIILITLLKGIDYFFEDYIPRQGTSAEISAIRLESAIRNNEILYEEMQLNKALEILKSKNKGNVATLEVKKDMMKAKEIIAELLHRRTIRGSANVKPN